MKILHRELPLFPLQTVLFPKMNLPLHIFEPRYREMIERCVAEELAFGVVLIQKGPEVGGAAVPCRVGTAAEIVEVERLPGGRMNINTVGLRRFRLLEYRQAESYLTGDIELWEDELGSGREIKARLPRARGLFQTYSRAILKLVGEENAMVDAPLTADPPVLSYAIAAALQGDLREKQLLLETPTVAERLAREVTILAREISLLRREVELRSKLEDEAATFYRN